MKTTKSQHVLFLHDGQFVTTQLDPGVKTVRKLAFLRLWSFNFSESLYTSYNSLEFNIACGNLKFPHYSNPPNKHAANLIIFEKFLPPTCLITTQTFINFWETCKFTVFCEMKRKKKSHLHALIKTSLLISFWKFFLHDIHIISTCMLIKAYSPRYLFCIFYLDCWFKRKRYLVCFDLI